MSLFIKDELRVNPSTGWVEAVTGIGSYLNIFLRNRWGDCHGFNILARLFFLWWDFCLSSALGGLSVMRVIWLYASPSAGFPLLSDSSAVMTLAVLSHHPADVAVWLTTTVVTNVPFVEQEFSCKIPRDFYLCVLCVYTCPLSWWYHMITLSQLPLISVRLPHFSRF